MSGEINRILMDDVKIRLEGISGEDQICTLHPFEVLKIIDEPDKPVDLPPPAPPLPENRNPITLLNWLSQILEWFKKQIE